MTTQTEVARLAPTQVDEATAVLTRAFFDDPLTVYIVPDEEKRISFLAWSFAKFVEYGLRYGHVDTTGSQVEGAALWLPPGNTVLTLSRLIKMGMFLTPLKLGLAGFRRFLNVTNHLEELHKRDVPSDHWYLFVLGVDPPHQGQGIGGRLIAPTLARADSEGQPCYLETMKERNVPFYQKHGFAVVVEGDLPKGGPHFWTMRREARAT